MDIDLLQSDDKMKFTEIFSNVEKLLSQKTWYASDFKTGADIKNVVKEWYIKGYMRALDDYKRLIG